MAELKDLNAEQTKLIDNIKKGTQGYQEFEKAVRLRHKFATAIKSCKLASRGGSLSCRR